MINHYQFGAITIDGKTYQSDVIIYPDKVDASWCRKEGHSLVPEDIPQIIQQKPEVLIIGCGATGCLKIPSKTVKYLHKQGIKLIAKNTTEACQDYNNLREQNQSVIAALHLTC